MWRRFGLLCREMVGLNMRSKQGNISQRGARILIGSALLIFVALGVWIYQASKWQAAERAAAPPRLFGFIQDSANIIGRDEHFQLDQKLRAFDALGGPQLVVATRTTLDRPIEEEALRLARAWRIGRAGANNGVLLLLVEREKQARIEVGYGLEGVLTDARARIIIANDIAPAMLAYDYTAAAVKGAEAILSAIHDGPIPERLQAQDGDDPITPLFFLFIALLIGVGLLQSILLAIPSVERRIARSRWFGWFARVRIVGGSSSGSKSSSSSSSSSGSSSSSSGGGGSFGGGGASG